MSSNDRLAYLNSADILVNADVIMPRLGSASHSSYGHHRPNPVTCLLTKAVNDAIDNAGFLRKLKLLPLHLGRRSTAWILTIRNSPSGIVVVLSRSAAAVLNDSV